MKDRPPSSYGAVYVPPHQRLRSVINASNYSSSSAVPASPFDSKVSKNQSSVLSHIHSSRVPYFQQQQEKQRGNGVCDSNHVNNNSNNHKFVSAYDDGISEEGSDREMECSMVMHVSDLYVKIMVNVRCSQLWYGKNQATDMAERTILFSTCLSCLWSVVDISQLCDV